MAVGYVIENPLMGSKVFTKLNLKIEEESKYVGNIEVNYLPDVSVMDNYILIETIRLLTEGMKQEEETIKDIGDTLVDYLNPGELHVKMNVHHIKGDYDVEVRYEFCKFSKYSLRRD